MKVDKGREELRREETDVWEVRHWLLGSEIGLVFRIGRDGRLLVSWGRLGGQTCLSSQSEVAKPLAGWHAKSLTNIRSAFTSELKTLNYGSKVYNY